MSRQFVSLEWKAFVRSASFKMNLLIKITLGVAAAFYGLLILFLGVAVFYLLEDKHMDPLPTVNRFLIYWWASDLVIRYFLQKLPVMQVRPFLTLPIGKNKIASFLLGKSTFSFFNFYPAFFFVPFSIVLIVNGYPVLNVISWHLAAIALVLTNNYLNLLINNKNAWFITIAILLAVLGLLQHFGYLDITLYTGPVFQSFFRYPALGFLVTLLPATLYYLNFRYFSNALRLDDAIQAKTEEVKTKSFVWLDRFGILGTFLKNDIRLISRNKRSKTSIWTSIFFLFYGLLLLSNSSYDTPTWKLFAGIFVTGGFLFTFGSFVPSWDSSCYPLMMSQNIKYKEYLASKWWLMVIVTFISMLLASFYLIWGWELYLAIIVGGIYNIGVNAHIVLLGGAFVKTPIDLNSGKKAFGDKNSFNLKTLLLTLPKIALPLIVFFIFNKIYNTTVGYLAVAALGFLGLAFRNLVFSITEKVYKQEKYSTLAAYKQKN